MILAQVESMGYELTVGGWIIMLTSVGFVTGLLIWCVRRVTRESSPEKIPNPLEVDTHDRDT